MFITFRFCRDWEFRAMKTQALYTKDWRTVILIIWSTEHRKWREMEKYLSMLNVGSKWKKLIQVPLHAYGHRTTHFLFYQKYVLLCSTAYRY
jgi:hypothetical protein